MLSLSENFGSCARGVSAPSVTPRSTILGLIAPNLNKTVPADFTTKVSASVKGAVGMAKECQKGAAVVKAEAMQTKGACAAQIKLAQREIIAACKASGNDAAKVFPDTSGPKSAAELGIDVLAAQGGGSCATFMNAMQTAEYASAFSADRANAPEGAMAAIEDALRRASAPSPAEFGFLRDSTAPAQMNNDTATDWDTVLDQWPEALAAIMYCDPDNPNLELFPELVALNDCIAAADIHIADMQAVIEAAPMEAAYSAAAVECMMHPIDQAPLVMVEDALTLSPLASLSGADIEAISRDAGAPAHDGYERGLYAMAFSMELSNRPKPPSPGMMAA